MKFFPDGRSVVDTIGVSRFKVLSHGQRDGYNTAKIEYLEDKKVSREEVCVGVMCVTACHYRYFPSCCCQANVTQSRARFNFFASGSSVTAEHCATGKPSLPRGKRSILYLHQKTKKMNSLHLIRWRRRSWWSF